MERGYRFPGEQSVSRVTAGGLSVPRDVPAAAPYAGLGDVLGDIVGAYQTGHGDGTRAYRTANVWMGRPVDPIIPIQYSGALTCHYLEGFRDGWFETQQEHAS
jgi:hypothetical protein